jgi:hypothetical protein
MPQFTGEKNVVLSSIGNPFEASQASAPRKALDPALRAKLAEFALVLDDIEECTHALRVDQIEDVIAQAVATCGFESSSQARATLEWMFHQSVELS